MTYPLPAQCSARPFLYRYTALFSHALKLGISQWEQCDTIVKSTLLILYREQWLVIVRITVKTAKYTIRTNYTVSVSNPEVHALSVLKW